MTANAPRVASAAPLFAMASKVGYLADILAERLGLRPLTLTAKVTRTPLRNDGRHAASVEISNGVSAYILTETKLAIGAEVKVKLATNGWELA